MGHMGSRDYQARVEGIPCWIPVSGWPGRYINVRNCGELYMVLMQMKDPLEVFVNRREFLPSSRFFISSQYDLEAVESNVKKHYFLPFFLLLLRERERVGPIATSIVTLFPNCEARIARQLIFQSHSITSCTDNAPWWDLCKSN